MLRRILKTIAAYVSITPTFSVCSTHGYIDGEQFTCPTCGNETEVWSRVVGYCVPCRITTREKGRIPAAGEV